MRKNVASQYVGFQMVNASDGTAVTTGTPTVYYTIDGGTQGTGGGTSTHEGNGQWSYAPAQAETNGNHVMFTMVLTNAISQCVNVYPVAYDPSDATDLGVTNLTGHTPQTGDSYARLGAPAGASVSADIADIPTVAEFNARTLVAASYFDPAADTVANVTTVATVTNDVGVNEWNGVLLATTNPLPNAAAGAAGGLPTDSTGKTSFNDIAATAIVSAGAITTSGGAVSTVTTTTSVTNDVGVNEWNGVALGTTNPLPNAAAGAAGGLPTDSTGKTSFNDITTAQVNTEVSDVLKTDTVTLPGQTAPPATPTLEQAISWLYKIMRNKTDQTSSTWQLYNDAGTTVDSKATVSEATGTFTKDEIVSGP